LTKQSQPQSETVNHNHSETYGILLETSSTFHEILTSEYHSILIWTVEVLQHLWLSQAIPVSCQTQNRQMSYEKCTPTLPMGTNAGPWPIWTWVT